MTKINKKEKEKQLFTEFLQERGFGVYNDSFSGRYLTIRKPKSFEKIHDFYFQEALNSNLDQLSPDEPALEFLNWLFNKGEHEILAKQAIKKTPSKRNYEYDSYVSKIINVISKNKKLLFEYVTRPSFLEASWDTLEKNNVFKNIDSQEHRIAIFEAIINTKTFKSLDTQKSVYNLAQKYLKQPEKFEQYFDRIEKAQDDEDIIDFMQTPAILIIGLTKEKMTGANLNSEGSSDSLVNGIINAANTIKETFPEELKIINAIMDYKDESKHHLLNIICDHSTLELNKFLFNKFINKFCRLSKWNEKLNFVKQDNIQLFFKETKAEFLHKNLQEDLCQEQLGNKKSFKV